MKKKTLLNTMNMNEMTKMLKEATRRTEVSHFLFTCKNCSISIIVDDMHGRKIEVALRTPEDDSFIILNSCNDDYYEEENSVIYNLPLSAFPAFITQFSNLETEAFSEVWNAWKTIATYS